MLEVIKIFANWGFLAALVLYLLWSYGKRMDKLDNTISNHLTHALGDNTKATKENSESGDRVERAVIQMSKSMDNLSSKIIEFMGKK